MFYFFIVRFVINTGGDFDGYESCSTADNVCDTDCSLREAITAAAVSGDTIEFTSPLFDSVQTITLAFGELYTDKTLIINGRAANLTIISGNNATRVFDIGGNVTFNGLTVTNGKDITHFGGGIYNDGTVTLNNCIISNNTLGGGSTDDHYGAGIYNAAGKTLNITNSAISNNRGNPNRDTRGFGIANFGTLTITNSTISGNTNTTNGNRNIGGGIYNSGALTLINSNISGNILTATNFAEGGGIYNVFSQSSVILINSTITQNSSVSSFSSRGGGLYFGDPVKAVNTIVSGNTSVLDSDVYRGFNIGINNFVGGDAKLDALANNGGATLTHSFLSGSPALNVGNNCVLTANACGFTHMALTTDQRGAGIWNENFSNPTITVRARNTIIAGNISGAGNPVDYVGDIANLGNNLINNANPGLAPLGNYGGATPTHALLPNSPALNAGDNCALVANTCGIAHSALPNDQRGTNTPRKVGTQVDIGAFERNITFDQSTLPNTATNLTYNQTLTVTRQSSFVDPANRNQQTTENFAPFTFSIVAIAGQQLPPGLTLNSNGQITGLPTTTGTYTFTVKATDSADGMSSVQQFVIQVFPPTAATASVSGRVLNPEGIGLVNAKVILTDSVGNSRVVTTSSFGYYRFGEVEVGQSYILSVTSKRCRFMPQILMVIGETTDLILLAHS